MHLFALVVTICSLRTGDCDNYATQLYKSSADCEAVAADMRRNPTPGILLIYCAPTTTRSHRHAR